MTDLEKLASQGDPQAQYELAKILCAGDAPDERFQTAKAWFLKAASQGHPLAMWKIGSSFELLDDKEACHWYRKAAEAGYPFAQYWLGVKYDRGEGVQQSADNAFKWFKRAAENGVPSACYELALRYEMGIGVVQNWQLSSSYYKLAADMYFHHLIREPDM